MCGDRITQDNDELTAEIRRNGLGNCVFQLGRRRDVNFLMAAATLVVSSSLSEGFPNVIAEAMACGTICVATDVGDTREIMGEFGLIVPPGDPGQLADAILGALAVTDISNSRERARARIVNMLSNLTATE